MQIGGLKYEARQPILGILHELEVSGERLSAAVPAALTALETWVHQLEALEPLGERLWPVHEMESQLGKVAPSARGSMLVSPYVSGWIAPTTMGLLVQRGRREYCHGYPVRGSST